MNLTRRKENPAMPYHVVLPSFFNPQSDVFSPLFLCVDAKCLARTMPPKKNTNFYVQTMVQHEPSLHN
eukprot:scaffold89578_cov55-Attheya_sp.AAC.5